MLDVENAKIPSIVPTGSPEDGDPLLEPMPERDLERHFSEAR